MRFIITGRDEAQKLLLNPQIASSIGAVVSVDNPGSPKPEGMTKKRYLRMEFNDVEDSSDKTKVAPTEQDIQRLIDSAPSLLSAPGKILCHCHHGIARSSASAYILNAISKGKGHEMEALQELVDSFPQIHPNGLMVELAAKLLNNPELLEDYNTMFPKRRGPKH
jgi:predicted protein tyrosine phosphatase